MKNTDALYLTSAKQDLVEKFDSLALKESFGDSIEMAELRQVLFDSSYFPNNTGILPGSSIQFWGLIKNYPITKQDVAHLNREAIFKKYEIHDFWNRLFYGQYIKVYKDRAGALKFVIGNMAWAFIISIIFMAFVHFILYIRHRRYYVEHVVFLMHFYSFVFLIFMIFGGFNFENTDKTQLGIQPISMLIMTLYFLVGLKRFYQQSWFKTCIKALLIFINFFCITLFIVFVISLISLSLF